MPTPDQWYQVYLRQSAALERIAADVTKLAAGGAVGGGSGGDGTIPFLRNIGDQILALKTELAAALQATGEGIADSILQHADAASSAAAYTAAAQIGREHLTATEGAAREDSVAGAIDKLAAKIAGDPLSVDAALRADLKLAQLLQPFLVPGSKTAAEEWADGTRSWANFWREIQQMVGPDGAPGKIITGISKTIEPLVGIGAQIASSVIAPLEIPFRGVLTAGIDDLLRSISAASKAHPADPGKVAIAGILSAHRLGHAAHGLAVAAEMHPMFHALGFAQMAAAVVDLSGFAPMSQAALRPFIEAAIARPMRYATNEQFAPYIPGDNALADHVRRRTLNLTDYDRWLAKLGYAEGHRDRMIETVWRDPSIRDLALMLEDVPVDEEWLKPRVRTMGYDDADADQITSGIVARTGKASRARLLAQAGGAYAEGTISGEEYEIYLADLKLSADAVRWERRAAELTRRRDAVRDALLTYRTEYVNGTISREDYVLALAALDVDPERQAGILADADVRRAPRIQRQEEAAIAATLSELRRELVPRYRKLYELGLVGADEYERMLVTAGLGPAVAAQAVSLDAARLRAAAAATGAAAAERQLVELLRERQDLAIARYRRGQLTDAQLAADLLAAGRPSDQVDVVVAQERLLRIPILARPPAISTEAVDRLTPEFRRRAALEDYRAGRIDEDLLYDELVAIGRTPEQAEAEVGYELARRPAPKP